MKAIYDFQKIGFKLKALFVIMILLASFSQLMALGGVDISLTPPATPSCSNNVIISGTATPTSDATGGYWILLETGTYSSTSWTSVALTAGIAFPFTGTFIGVPAGSGTYTITLTTYNTGPTDVDAGTTTATITVSTAPVGTVSNNGPLCEGSTLNLTGGPGGMNTYGWTGPDGFVSALQSPSILSVTSAKAGSYSLIVNNGTCASTATTTTVVVNLTPTISGLAAIPAVCYGTTSGTLTYTGTTADRYSITYSAPAIAAGFVNVTNATMPASPITIVIPAAPTGGGGTFTGTLTVKNNTTGCVNTGDGISVTVTPIVGTPVFSLGASSSRCLGAGAGTYTASATNTSGPITYALDPASLAALNTIDPNTGVVTFMAGWAGPSIITATAPGCGGATNANHTVTMTTPPTATISYTGSPWCTSDAVVKSVTLNGTGVYQPGGTYTSTAGGLSISTSTGAITPSSSTAGTYTITYTGPASGGCAGATATTSVTVTLMPTATISYAGSPMCSTAGVQSVALNGTGDYTAGTYTSTVGLSISTSTGAITPGTSTAGIYTITYTGPVSGGCAAATATTSVTVTAAPTATISYAGSPMCSTAGVQSVILNGTGDYTAGTYTSTVGLSISTSTGAITPGTSTAGTYTITYTGPASGGCAAATATTSVTVTTAPTASISYTGSPWCTSDVAVKLVNLTGSGTYSPSGTFAASAGGLTINASTGTITPSSSTAGTYTITYTGPVSGGCAGATATTSVTVTAAPTASISYTGSPWCTNDAVAKTVNLTGTGAYQPGGTYSSTVGLNINTSTGAITPNLSTYGSYTVTYTGPVSGGCAAATASTSVTISALPVATFSYSPASYCQGESNPSPTYSGGGSAGTFTAVPSGLVFVSSATGEVDLLTSAAGTYTVTNTKSAFGGCGIVTATASIEVKAGPLPIATNSSPVCSGGAMTLTGSAPTGTTITQYVWDGPNGFHGQPNFSYTIYNMQTVNAGVYTLTATYSTGCVRTNTTLVVVNEATVGGTITPATAQACSGTNSTGLTLGGQLGTVQRWESSLDGSTWALAATTSSTTYTAVNLTQTTYYRAVVKNGDCAEASSASSTVTVTQPAVATFTYAGSPYCSNGSNPTPTFTGGGVAGTFTASPSGLTFVSSSTGVVNLSSTTPGTYTVTNTISAATPCPAVYANYSLTITPLPTATISYEGPYCVNGGTVSVTLSGTGAYTGGTYSAPSGLSINSTTGTVNPSLCTAGTYTVTYTTVASSGCSAITATAPITITALPVATFSYTGTPYCKNGTNPSPTFSGGGVAGTFTASSGGLVFVSSTTGVVDLTASTAGTYTVTNTIAAALGCSAVTATSQITINPLPTGTIAYTASPYCSSLTTASVTPTSLTSGGTYSILPVQAGVSVGSSNGTVTFGLTNVGTFTVTYTVAAAGGCSEFTTTAPIVISPTPTISATSNSMVCLGDTLKLYATSSASGSTFTWDGPSGFHQAGTNTYIAFWPMTSGNAGTYTLTVTATGYCTNVTTTVVAVAPPTVPGTVTPSQTICYNTAPADLTLGGSTGSVTKWQKASDVSFTSPVDIANTTTTLASAAIGNLVANTYFRAVVKSGTCVGGYSEPALITVNPNLLVGSISASQSICAGATPAQLTGVAPSNGTLPTYQWQSSLDNSTFNNISAATTLNYQPGPLSAVTYFRLQQNASNTCLGPLPTNVVTISMNPVLLVGSISASQSICSGSTPALLTGVAPSNGTSPTYQWQISLNNSTYTDISGANALNYQPGALTTTTYYKQLQNATGTCTGPLATNVVTISMNPVLLVGSISASQSICAGTAPAQLAGVAPSNGTSPVYQWQSSLDNSTFNNISGATTQNYQPGTLSAVTYFRQLQNATGTCTGPLATNVVTISMNPNLLVGSISASQSICSGSAPALLTGVAPSNGTSPTYQWQISLNNSTYTDISGANALNYQPGALTTTTYYKQLQNATGTCTGPLATNVVTISMNPVLLVGSISASQSICAGTAPAQLAGVAPSNGTSPSYQWQSSLNNSTFTNVTGATTLNYQPGTLSAVTYYRQLQNATGTCTGPLATNVVTISMNPVLVVGSVSANQTIVAGNVPAQLAGTAPNGTSPTYQWQSSLNNVTFSNISGATTLTYQPGALTTTTYYRQSQNATGVCGGPLNTNVVTITVTYGTIAGYVNYDNTYATGLNSVNVRLKNPVSGSTIQTAVTGPDGSGTPGYYLFTSVIPGSYRLVADFPTGVWGGNNATDALIISLNTIGSWPLYWLRDTVADVNIDHVINSTDALYIKERVAGNITSYPAGDWKFTDTTVTHNLTSNVNLKGLCVGDVNGSYANPFKEASFLSAVEDEVITVPVNQSFTYDIKSNSVAQLGAMTLFMNYDETRFSVDKIVTPVEGLSYRIENGRVAIAWSNTRSLSLNPDETIISLKMTAKELMPEPVQVFAINSGSEFADPSARRLNDFDLKMAKVITSASDLSFSMINYPNPFRNFTEIVYTIPVDGKVKLVVTNMFGQAVRTLVDEQQAAGTYKVKVKSDDGYLQPGLYLYTIEVDGATATFNKTNKMLFTR